jgi:hypothetical protein
VPGAEWLANNVPSPPLHKMLSEYLPQMPVKLKVQGRVLRPPTRVLTTLKKGVYARNTTIHIGSEPPQPDQLKELLLSVRDLLYLLDYYCGNHWAADNIRDETKEEMLKEFGLVRTVLPSN